MVRGTTPTLTFNLPFECSAITMLNIAFCQHGNTVIEKGLSDVTMNGRAITLRLTERETLQLNSDFHTVDIQLRVGCGTERLVSNVITTSVDRILREGCLS